MQFPGAEVTDRNLLTTDCDILVPAAGEKQITADIANDIKAKVVCMGFRYTPKCVYRAVPMYTIEHKIKKWQGSDFGGLVN